MLLNDLKDQLGLTYILISHDLAIVNYMADKIAVMYLGKVVEHGEAEKVFAKPAHPYTKALFAAVADPETEGVDDSSPWKGMSRAPSTRRQVAVSTPDVLRLSIAVAQKNRSSPSWRTAGWQHA